MAEFIKIEGKREITKSSDEAIQSVVDQLDREAHGLGSFPIKDVEVLKPISLTKDLDKTIEVIESFSEKVFGKDNPIHIHEIRSQLKIVTNLEKPASEKLIAEFRKAA